MSRQLRAGPYPLCSCGLPRYRLHSVSELAVQLLDCPLGEKVSSYITFQLLLILTLFILPACTRGSVGSDSIFLMTSLLALGRRDNIRSLSKPSLLQAELFKKDFMCFPTLIRWSVVHSLQDIILTGLSSDLTYKLSLS